MTSIYGHLTPEMQRYSLAVHEAGHAVMFVATDQRFEYVTLRPRNPQHAGHVMTRGQGCLRDGRWADCAATYFAGIIAEELYLLDSEPLVPDLLQVGSTGHEQLRRELARTNGRMDLTYARNVIRVGWYDHQEPEPRFRPDPPIGDWSMADMAVHAWRRAVRLVVEHIDAIDAVAEELVTSARGLRWREVRDIVAEVGSDPSEVFPAEFLHPWFLDHTRLKWAPSQTCDTRAAPVAARNAGGEP